MATPVLPGGTGINGVFELVWSPDGKSLAYIARLGEAFKVQRLDVESGVAETVTEVEVSVASTPAVCWSAEGEVVVGWQPKAHCSTDYSCVPYKCSSPDGERVARLEPSEAEGVTLLKVESADGATLWERELADVVADRVMWSSDGSILLLDGGLDTLIWRVPADSSGELEAAVEEGQLISIVSQW